MGTSGRITYYYCDILTFFDVYILELLRLETIKFGNASLSDINVVLCYVLSQYSLGSYHALSCPVGTLTAALFNIFGAR